MKIKFQVLLIIVLLTTITSSAFAGKPERDKVDQLKPRVEEVTKAIESNCGCLITATVNWDSYTKAEHMDNIGFSFDSLNLATKSFCEKEGDKKAFCDNVKEFQLTFAEKANIEVQGQKLIATSDPSAYVTAFQLKDIMNKF